MRKYFPASVAALLFFTLIILSGCRQESAPALPPPSADNTEQAAESPARKPGIAEDYLNTNRVIWQKPDLVLQQLGDLKDKTVADIGAGTGFFSLRMATVAQKVVAIDIDPRFVSHLDSLKKLELPADIQSRLETRLAKPNDPNLRPGEADVIVIVNTYMYIKDRVGYLRNLKNGLSDGGRLLIVDFKKKRMPLGPPQDIRVPLFQAEDELYEAGYRDIATNDTSLDYQYIITARK
ncbi:MAG TPA: methyltransferase [Saprospiraceae bacterium]|nr:methyltransferase [Saprospiraceae bacterium]